MANLERIREVVELIEGWEQDANSKYKLDMDSWYERGGKDFCDTAVCFAGAAVVHAKLPVHTNPAMPGSHIAVVLEDGTVRSIEAWAAEYLGLDYHQAEEIFYSFVTDADGLKEKISSVLGEKVFQSETLTA